MNNFGVIAICVILLHDVVYYPDIANIKTWEHPLNLNALGKYVDSIRLSNWHFPKPRWIS